MKKKTTKQETKSIKEISEDMLKFIIRLYEDQENVKLVYTIKTKETQE